jgi:hypothetical protein
MNKLVSKLGGGMHIVIVTVSLTALSLFSYMIAKGATSSSSKEYDTTTICTPTIPKVVRHMYFYPSARDLDAYVSQCVRDGFIIKTIAATNSGWYVVAEKY